MNKPTAEHRPILGPDGRPMILGRIVPMVGPPEQARWEHDPERPTHQSFDRYCAWRRTKCRPRDLRNPEQRLEDLDEATHQFVGEVGELGELIESDHIHCVTIGESIKLLIDECGDVWFCGLWLCDAYGLNPFLGNEEVSPDQVQRDESVQPALDLHLQLAALDPAEALTDAMMATVLQTLQIVSWRMLVNATLLCNTFKKIRWQRRPQDREAAVNRIVNALCYTEQLLVISGHTVEDALARNVEKLDARFPEGYVGPGGGIRQGKGA